jgi:hypothetical protein
MLTSKDMVPGVKSNSFHTSEPIIRYLILNLLSDSVTVRWNLAVIYVHDVRIIPQEKLFDLFKIVELILK